MTSVGSAKGTSSRRLIAFKRRGSVNSEPTPPAATVRGGLQSLQGRTDVGRFQPSRIAGAVPAAPRSTQAARVQGDPPRPGPSTSPPRFKEFHRLRPYCAGGERSASFIPGGRRQTVAPCYSQSGGARAATEAESGFGEASCLRRSLCHGLRSTGCRRLPGRRHPAPLPGRPTTGAGCLTGDETRRRLTVPTHRSSGRDRRP